MTADLGRPDMTLIASAQLTGGVFELVEEVRPAGSGPTPHVHRERDEGFYVLEGRYTFVRDREEIDASPGDFIFIPRGTRHAFRALEDHSRTLIVIAPAGLEGFFREMGPLLAGGASSLEAMTALSDRFDSHPVE